MRQTMSVLGSRDAAQPRIPSSFELAELIDKVLSDWAFLSAVPAGKPAQGPADLGLEFSVALVGPVDGFLVLRCGADLAADVAQASTGDPGARSEGPDAFKELCNLVASHLMTTFLAGGHLDFLPFVPKLSQPGEWPAQPADAESVMLVENHPLEARLWVHARAEAPRG
jgi:hypothetical protein